MQRDSVAAVVRALNEAQVRYLIAGGLAVVAHGYVRLTADLDIVLDLADGNVRKALRALASLGYRPRAPVPIEDFADPAKRRLWIKEKGLKVFSLFSDAHRATEIDVFVEPPFDFEDAYSGRVRQAVDEGVEAAFVGFDELVSMKRKAGRAQDLLDIEKLRAIREDGARG